MKWDNLTMSQKQALMKIYVNNGVTNLDEIVNHYNRYAEGGPASTPNTSNTENNTVMYSRTPRELIGNVVNTRPVPGLITMTEVPRMGAGINLPFKELIDRFVLEKTNTPSIINTDSISRPNSYITRPSRINRFDDGGIKDTWKPKYWFTPKYEAESLKEAITKAYDDGKKGDNIIYKGNAYKALLNDTDELQYNKEKQWENNRSITKDQVVDTYIDKIMWTMENPNDTGYNKKKKKYYSYADSAIPFNLGPGIAYTSEAGKKLDYKKGYTKEELNAVIRPELLKHMDEIENQLHSKYGEAADTMSLGNRIALLDIAHNVRPRENKKANMPVTGFPKLTESMMMGNDKSARKNTYSGSKRRQLMRNDLLWLNDFSDFILKNR